MKKNITNWFKQIAAPPYFADPEKNRTARLLYYLLPVLLVSITGLLLNNIFLGESAANDALAAMALVLFVPLWLTRQGYVESASIIIIIALLVSATYIFQKADGLHDVGIAAYPTIVVFASLLLSWRNFVLVVVVTITAVGWLAAGEWYNFFTPIPYTRQILPADFVTTCIILITTAIISRVMANSLVRSLAKAQEEIVERQRVETQYRLLFESSPQGIIIFNKQGNIDMANVVATQMLNYTIAELQGQPPQLILDSVDLAKQPIEVERLRAGELVTKERVLVRKNGERFYVAGSNQQMPDGRFQYIFHDITLRKQLDKTLETRTEQLTRLNSISRAISTLQHLDKVFESIFQQVSAAMATDKFIVCLYNPQTNELSYPFLYDDGQQINEPTIPIPTGSMFTQVIETGEALLINRTTEEIDQRKHDLLVGKGFFLGTPKVSASLMFVPMIAQSRIIGLLSVQSYTLNAFDETNLNFLGGVALQAAIAIENARLFEALQKELEERQLLIRELEAKNTELERFTYTVSHDLKSPLVTIKGFLGFLEKDITQERPDRIMGDIQRIRDAADKMQLLLTELLELSRIGRLMNPPQLVPMTAIVHEALMAVHGRISERAITVTVAEDLPSVYGDRARLVEVVQNLVDNAAKYMGQQPAPQITIGATKQGQENVFFVQDNGMGIAPHNQQQIFDLFNKIDPKSEGTGIGLTLVKRIIEVHNGRIWVESAGLGHGTTFYFVLPG